MSYPNLPIIICFAASRLLHQWLGYDSRDLALSAQEDEDGSLRTEAIDS